MRSTCMRACPGSQSGSETISAQTFARRLYWTCLVARIGLNGWTRRRARQPRPRSSTIRVANTSSSHRPSPVTLPCELLLGATERSHLPHRGRNSRGVGAGAVGCRASGNHDPEAMRPRGCVAALRSPRHPADGTRPTKRGRRNAASKPRTKRGEQARPLNRCSHWCIAIAGPVSHNLSQESYGPKIGVYLCLTVCDYTPGP